LPRELLPILAEGVGLDLPDAYLFRGLREGKPLSACMVCVIVKTLARAADIKKPVTPMTLRHGYAVCSLDLHGNIRLLQESLGHAKIATTMKYLDLLQPSQVTSPLDAISENCISQPNLHPSPLEDLFDENPLPEDVESLLIPENPVASFYRLLKTHLRGCFGAMRRPPPNTNDPPG